MFFVLLCIVCFQDLRTGKISNVLVIIILTWGAVYNLYSGHWLGTLDWGAKVLLYLGILYPMYKIGALGAGDVKVLAAMEGVFSWNTGFIYFAVVWFIAGAGALVKLLSQGNCVERLEYFLSYVRDVAMTGNWQFYHEERADSVQKERTVRMSLPFLLGFVLCMGG